MTSRAKNVLYSVFLFLLVYAVWKYRQWNTEEPIKLEGKTMGTTYHITYFDKEDRNFKTSVDSLLTVFNQSLSTYITDSEISNFNKGTSIGFKLPYFYPVLEKSRDLVKESEGAFDPTVMPLVNAWGFGPGKKLYPDSIRIDSIMQFVGFEKIRFNEDSIWKEDRRVQLDFSAIAKGYGVDEVVGFLQSRRISDLFVEIGGEVSVKGRNTKLDKAWTVGILDPNSTYANQSFMAYAQLENKAMATSGNYFNYYEQDGQKVSHTINPINGFPIQHKLLSASVFANNCMTADAWATAFMVMGHEKAIEKLKNLNKIDVFLIYSTEDGIKSFVSEGVKSSITLTH